MPLRLGAAKQAISSTLQAPPGHVWISDGLLREAFDCFVSIRIPQCKRHGCNVPGPLEARRRLAKRRMNHLSIDNNAAVTQPGSISSFGWLGCVWAPPVEPEWRWEPPGLTQGGSSPLGAFSLPLPSWLDVKPPAPSTPIPYEIVTDSEEHSLQNPLVLSIDDYKARLASVSDLKGLRELHFELRNVAVDAEACSYIAFKHLLHHYHQARRFSTAQSNVGEALRAPLFEFLQDPSLDFSNGLNLQRLAASLAEDMLTLREYGLIITILKDQLAQKPGVAQHLHSIVDNLLTVVSNTNDTEKPADLYWALWRIVVNSKLSAHPARDVAIVQAFLVHVVKLRVERRTVRLLKNILRFDSDRENMQNLQHRDISHEWRALLGRCMQFLMLYHSRIDSISPGAKISGFLQSLNSPAYVRHLALLTTRYFAESLKCEVYDRVPRLKTLNHWLAAIRGCGYVWSRQYFGSTWASLFDTISAVALPVEILEQFAAISDREMPWILLNHWIRRDIQSEAVPDNGASATERSEYNNKQDSKLEAAYTEDLSLGSTQDNFPETAQQNSHGLQTTEGPLEEIFAIPQQAQATSGILLKIQQAYLACCASPFHRRARLSKHAVQLSSLLSALRLCTLHLTSERALEHFLSLTLALDRPTLFDSLARATRLSTHNTLQFTIRHRPLLASFITRTSFHYPSYALRIFNLDRRLPLSSCPTLLLDLIRSPRSRVHPRRILALLEHSDPGGHEPCSGPGGTATRRYGVRCRLTPERVHLVHEAAMMFAECARLSDRTAWECVRACFVYLRSHRAPLGPGMGKAMVRAGVVRAVKGGGTVPAYRLRMILGVVEAVEGREAAEEVDRLVWRLTGGSVRG